MVLWVAIEGTVVCLGCTPSRARLVGFSVRSVCLKDGWIASSRFDWGRRRFGLATKVDEDCGDWGFRLPRRISAIRADIDLAG